MDEKTHYQTESLIAIPIRIEQEVCGVLELINRRDAPGYSQEDRNLLEIFAGYISISIQNVLDGRQAQEIAKRDNLTGLFNDRYLHIAPVGRPSAAARRRTSTWRCSSSTSTYFKRVNDTHGHLAGSQVLREVGHLLRRQVSAARRHRRRATAATSSCCCCPGCDLEQAVDLAEEIRAEIVDNVFCDEPGEIQPEPLHLQGLTCSIGVATLKQHIAGETSRSRTARARCCASPTPPCTWPRRPAATAPRWPGQPVPRMPRPHVLRVGSLRGQAGRRRPPRVAGGRLRPSDTIAARGPSDDPLRRRPP